jgi:ADP-heptose:LPS heptosyltransferase
MHTLTLTEPLDIGPNGILEPGDYLVEDVNGGQLLSMAWNAKLTPFEWTGISSNAWDNILIVRPGGFGDLLLLSPVIKAMRKFRSHGTVTVATFPQYKGVFDNTDTRWAPYPILKSDLWAFSTVYFLENSIERGEPGKRFHMTDVFASHMAVEVIDKEAEYILSPEEKTWAEDYCVKKWPVPGSVKRIAIQCQASTHCRDYPQLGEVIAQLYAKGWHCFLLGSPYSISVQNKLRITNCTLDNLTFRQSAAVLDACDIVLGPDSALVHVAGAINKPAVGLYGPFPWQLRTAYASNTVAIQGHGECAPCFYHGRNGEHFPRNGPCHKVGKCVVLDSIRPESIVQKVEAHYASFSTLSGCSGPIS